MNALELRILDLAVTGGRLDIAAALADLDPEIAGQHETLDPPKAETQRVRRRLSGAEICECRAIARIEDSLRTAPEWMWHDLLNHRPVAPFYRFLQAAA